MEDGGRRGGQRHRQGTGEARSALEEAKLLEAIKTAWAAYVVQDKKILELVAAGDASFADHWNDIIGYATLGRDGSVKQ